MSWPLFKTLCLLVCNPEDQALAHLPEDPHSWQNLLRLAREQQVDAALACRILEPGQHPRGMADDTWCQLKTLAVANTRRNMQIIAQSRKLALSLNRAGIVPMFLKGSSQLLQPRQQALGARQQLDIDLIVPEADLARAGQALLADGYAFCTGSDPDNGAPLLTGDPALWRNARHHHLLPLVKPGYGAPVELHRHYLPRRFQPLNPASDLLAKGREIELNGCRFQVPSTEHEIIHLILGRFIYDRFASARDFPIRSASDYIITLSAHRMRSTQPPDWRFMQDKCGSRLDLFRQLVAELTGFRDPHCPPPARSTGLWRGLLALRYGSPGWARCLDASGRLGHLASALRYTPGKLPAYIGRLGSQGG